MRASLFFTCDPGCVPTPERVEEIRRFAETCIYQWVDQSSPMRRSPMAEFMALHSDALKGERRNDLFGILETISKGNVYKADIFFSQVNKAVREFSGIPSYRVWLGLSDGTNISSA